MKSSSNIILKPGREKSLKRHHPWIFSGAVQTIEGSPAPGETVDVRSSKNDWLAKAAISPQSQILARVWTFTPNTDVDATFFDSKLQHCMALRETSCRDTNAYRVINAESDGLPGLIVDRYQNTLVCQFLSAGAEFWKSQICECLSRQFPADSIYERSDADVRKKEGLPLAKGALKGNPPALITITENEIKFNVDIHQGHKTGFYLDQRDNRAIVAKFATGKEVLNCFSYTGGFGVSALTSGAKQVTNIDTSAAALQLVNENCQLNALPTEKMENLEGDVFQLLRKFRDSRRSFDMIILDPPKFAESKSHQDKAIRGYKDINLLAFKLLRPGGILATFSCSGLINADLFQKIVAGAALDAEREATINRWLYQAPDHPVSLAFPEGTYLKGLLCSVS